MSITRRGILSASLGVAVAALGVAQPAGASSAGANPIANETIYTQTNAAAGNTVVAFRRDRSGRLTPSATYPTGGMGTGTGLGSQGAVTLTADGRYLLAVNAGSNTVTAFAVLAGQRLRRLGSAPSGGVQPISVTAARGLVFVVNAGDVPTVTGFRLNYTGLHTVPGSTRPVAAGGAGPAQISFTPDGWQLVVTLKPTNRIDVFPVDLNGRAGAPTSTASSGATPFGFSFDRRGNLLVSNAEGGAAGASSVTSYRIGSGGGLTVLNGPVGTGQSAACWLVVTVDGRFAYTTNTASNNVSSFAVARDGRVHLSEGVAARTDAGPLDAAINSGGGVLFVLNGPGRSIAALAINHRTGGLTPLTAAGNLPAGLVGLAVT
jgi:6-phosphogluconolactonase